MMDVSDPKIEIRVNASEFRKEHGLGPEDCKMECWTLETLGTRNPYSVFVNEVIITGPDRIELRGVFAKMPWYPACEWSHEDRVVDIRTFVERMCK